MTREEAELLSKKYVMESDIAMREYRAAIIEECARVAESVDSWAGLNEVVAAIRALKEKL